MLGKTQKDVNAQMRAKPETYHVCMSLTLIAEKHFALCKEGTSKLDDLTSVQDGSFLRVRMCLGGAE